MAPRRRAPAPLIASLASVAGAAALALALAHVRADWRPELLALGTLGCATWGIGLLWRRGGLVAHGVAAIGLEAVLGLAALNHPGAGVGVVGPALLLAAEAGFLAVELPPQVRGGPAACDRGLWIGAIAVAGWLLGVVILDSGVTEPVAILDAAAVSAVLALAAGLTRALRQRD
jgi:hypothetical protein